MILTKDNLLRFIREKKYVTPTTISESFETTTMIASAALSELSKDKLIAISNLKIGSTPYYYDPLQKSVLVELGEKHFSSYDKEIFLKLREAQVLNDNSLTIQERLAIERIKDFAIPLEITFQSQTLKFWVWYLRDIKETRSQILDAINPKKETPKDIPKEIKKDETQSLNSSNSSSISEKTQTLEKHVFKPRIPQAEEFEDKVDVFIKNYLVENYLKLVDKEEKKNGTYYKAKININNIEVIFDCYYFEKKPKDGEIISFYSSSQNPKIIFMKNAAKKYFKLCEEIDNLTIVNI